MPSRRTRISSFSLPRTLNRALKSLETTPGKIWAARIISLSISGYKPTSRVDRESADRVPSWIVNWPGVTVISSNSIVPPAKA